jgi:hypothetical protein
VVEADRAVKEFSSWPGIAVRRTALLPLAYDPAIHAFLLLDRKASTSANDPERTFDSASAEFSKRSGLPVRSHTASGAGRIRPFCNLIPKNLKGSEGNNYSVSYLDVDVAVE